MDVFGSVGGNWSAIKPTKEEHANPTSKGTWNLFRQKRELAKKKKQRMAPCKNANKLKKKHKPDTSKCT